MSGNSENASQKMQSSGFSSEQTSKQPQLNNSASKNEKKMATQDARFQDNSKSKDAYGKDSKHMENPSSNRGPAKQKRIAMGSDCIRVFHRSYNKPNNRNQIGSNRSVHSSPGKKESRASSRTTNSEKPKLQDPTVKAETSIEVQAMNSAINDSKLSDYSDRKLQHQQQGPHPETMQKNVPVSVVTPTKSITGIEIERPSYSPSSQNTSLNSWKFHSIEADLGIKSLECSAGETDDLQKCLERFHRIEAMIKAESSLEGKNKTILFLPDAFADSNVAESAIIFQQLYGTFTVLDVKMHFNEDGERIGSGSITVLEKQAEQVKKWASERNWRAVRLMPLKSRDDKNPLSLYIDFKEKEWCNKRIQCFKELSGVFEGDGLSFLTLYKVDGKCAQSAIAKAPFINVKRLFDMMNFTKLFMPQLSADVYQIEEE
uniref:DUF1995 domain-containing protein n=2 Tax=Caenorhabditis tropicalis TaxID=1561998 RepID=A0A1I7TKJ6_9PELO